jgi:hypothetical protein
MDGRPGGEARVWRLGLELAGRPYYLHLRVGSERRSAEPRVTDGAPVVRVRRPYVTAGLVLGTLLLIVAGTAATIVLGLYLLKSLAGINLMAGASPLHPIYDLLFR